MASRRNYFQSPIQSSTSPSTDHRFEFHESDLWNSDDDHRSPISPPEPRRRSTWNRSSARKTTPVSANSASSLPVNIPDWSKILGSGGGRWRRDGGEDQEGDVDGEEDDEEEEDRVPPHEHAARQVARRSGMVVAFSVHEGVGRTLKGRDLSRVRNAIWKQTGFED